MRVSSPVIESVEVARYLMSGARTVLECRYTYQAQLYSIRWYKNGKEFYRSLTLRLSCPTNCSL